MLKRQQKFKTGDFVKVSDKMSQMMSHFEKGFIGCIVGSYNDLYGCRNYKDYCVIQFVRGCPVNRISWYPEELLERFDSYNLMKYFEKNIRSK